MFVNVKESKLPTLKSKAWTLKFTIGEGNMSDECLVSVFGGGGSLKARFTVSLKDLKSKVSELSEVDINDAQHPIRRKAIQILESITEKLNKPRIFNSTKKDNTRWYDFEDMVTEIIAEGGDYGN